MDILQTVKKYAKYVAAVVAVVLVGVFVMGVISGITDKGPRPIEAVVVQRDCDFVTLPGGSTVAYCNDGTTWVARQADLPLPDLPSE